MAEVQVEFFGIPRARAGLAQTPASAETLGELIEFLSLKFPTLGACCFEGKCLKPGYVANLSGDRFTTDPTTPLRPGDTVLILSMDAGG